MALSKVVRRVLILDQLILKEETGNAGDLAKVLGISRRQVYHYLRAFNHIGKVHTFDHRRGTYVYQEKRIRHPDVLP